MAFSPIGQQHGILVLTIERAEHLFRL